MERNVYRLSNYQVKRLPRIEGSPYGVLASVRCVVCRNKRAPYAVGLPNCDGRLVPKGILSKFVGGGYREKRASLDDFAKGEEEAQGMHGKPIKLVPGAFVGPYGCRATEALGADFEKSAPGGPVLKKALVEKLRGFGFAFETLEITIRNAREFSADYVFVIPKIVSIFDERCLEGTGIVRCATCGNTRGKTQDEPNDPVFFREPESHLAPFMRVFPYETHVILAPKLATFFLKEPPTGVGIVPWGSWAR